MAAYRTPATFKKYARKNGYEKTFAGYRNDVEDALQKAIYAVLERYKDDPDGPVGLCIRAFNDNAQTQELLEGLKLDTDRIEVIKYFGTVAEGGSVKRV